MHKKIEQYHAETNGQKDQTATDIAASTKRLLPGLQDERVVDRHTDDLFHTLLL
jgi:hypothetical protein